MWLKTLSLVFLVMVAPAAPRSVTINNKCGYSVWFDIKTEDGDNALDGTVTIGSGSSEKYDIPNTKWNGRFYAKTGCDESGTNCASGEMQSCHCEGCCPTPTQTVIQFKFQENNTSRKLSDEYIIALENGYNLPLSIMPNHVLNRRCTSALCNVTLDDCPTDENYDLGDLRVLKGDSTVQCLSPCRKMTLPQPNGLGKSINECTYDLFITKYMELMNYKCFGSVIPPNKAHLEWKSCLYVSSYEVVACP